MPLATFRRSFLTCLAASVVVAAVAEDASKKEVREVKVEDLTLTVPASWKQGPPSNRLRLAEFAIPKAEGDEATTDMVVSYFGGGAGGVDANLGRWLGQFENDGRQVKITKGTSKAGDYYFADITGIYNMPVGPPILRKTQPLPNARMAAVILDVKDKGNYFLKMAGPEKSVAAAIDDLRASFGGDKATEKPYELK